MKEQMIPSGANKILFLLAPIISVAPALAAWATEMIGARRTPPSW